MARLSSQQVQRHRAQDRHMLCAIALAHTTIVFTQADIEDPMERMFHAPALPDGVGETHGIAGKRGQKLALLARDVTPYFAVCLNQTHTGNLRPRPLYASALDIRGEPIVARCQATMVGVDRGMMSIGDVIQPGGLDVVEQQGHL